MLLKCLKCALLVVAPVMSLKIRGVTDRSVDLEWEGSAVLTDFLVTYTPSSAGGGQRPSGLLLQKIVVIYISCRLLPVSLSGVPFEMRLPGNTTTTCTILGLEAGLEYNINIFGVINNSISVPASITVSTCKRTSLCCSKEIASKSNMSPFVFVFPGEDLDHLTDNSNVIETFICAVVLLVIAWCVCLASRMQSFIIK